MGARHVVDRHAVSSRALFGVDPSAHGVMGGRRHAARHDPLRLDPHFVRLKLAVVALLRVVATLAGVAPVLVVGVALWRDRNVVATLAQWVRCVVVASCRVAFDRKTRSRNTRACRVPRAAPTSKHESTCEHIQIRAHQN